MRETYMETGFVRLCWEKLFSLMVLNGLFLICALGVVTLPAALTALNRGCQDLLLEKKGMGKQFFRTFRQSLLTALPLGLLFPAAPVALIYGCLFYGQNAGQAPLLLFGAFLCLFGAVLTIFAGMFAYAMLSRAELSPWAAIRNAFLLLSRGYAFGWLLLSLAMGAAFVLLFPHSLPALLLLGASLPCFAAARGTLPVLDRLVVREAGAQES